jgi:hypothetical protein
LRETWRRSPIDRASAKWCHRIHPELLLPVYRPNASSSSTSLTFGFGFQHQQVALVDVISRARRVDRHIRLKV